MRDHPREGYADGGCQSKKNVELPQAVNVAAQEQPGGEYQTAGRDDVPGSKTIQKMPDHGRQNCIYDQNHGKHPGRGAATPTIGVEERHVKNSEGRVKSASKPKDHEGQRGDKPWSRRKSHSGQIAVVFNRVRDPRQALI
jgi:hypothetical protein